MTRTELFGYMEGVLPRELFLSLYIEHRTGKFIEPKVIKHTLLSYKMAAIQSNRIDILNKELEYMIEYSVDWCLNNLGVHELINEKDEVIKIY